MVQQKSSISQEKKPGNKPDDPTPAKAGTTMKIHPIAAILIAMAWPMMGFFLCMVVKMAIKIEISKIVQSIINLGIGCFGVFYLFPVLYRAPFGAVPMKEYLKRIGLCVPPRIWQHILLGIILALCTLSGMLLASWLSGRYELDWSTINLKHIIFSLNPGIFEEIFYRGIIVMLLLPLTRSLQKALIWQIFIFGLAHIKGFDWLVLVDAVSVMIIAIAFTYAAYKTRALVVGIVFHFLHDAFLFFVQVPHGVYNGWQENMVFYGILWLMVGVGCFIIWFATERLNIRGESELYILKAE
jgi:membrane protease YdiL (CAAX protease family)